MPKEGKEKEVKPSPLDCLFGREVLALLDVASSQFLACLYCFLGGHFVHLSDGLGDNISRVNFRFIIDNQSLRSAEGDLQTGFL